MSAFSEKVAQIDAKRTLVGILTAPAGQAPADRPALVILNTGLVHRVGHNRMFVTFARDMAATGYGVLRFDLSGLGDSGNRHGAVPPLVANMSDIREAADWMERRGYPRIVLLGLCSGADQSIVYAGEDSRVVGLVLLDPSIPHTRRFITLARRHRVTDFLRRNGYSAVFARVRKSIRSRLSRREADAELLDDEDETAPQMEIGIHRKEVRDYIEGAYSRAAKARIQIMAMFTAGLPHQHNYREQILDAFPDIPFGDRLTLAYLDGVDHTFVREADRQAMFARVKEWITTADFPAPGSALPAR